MKKAMGFALAVLATAVVATTAQGGQKIAATSQASFNCKSTITLPFITPLTGGAGFLGQEQASWAKYAVKTLAPQYGLKVKLALGDTPVEAGPGAGARAGAEVHRRQECGRDSRTVHIG